MEKENRGDFDLPPEGLLEDEITRALEKFDDYLNERKLNFLGFQAYQDLHYSFLAPYLNCQINNLGDPYEDGDFKINSKEIEKAVLDYYATLWNGKPHDQKDRESCWGYVLSMGSTEGNLYGLWNARDYLAGMPLLKSAREPISEVSLHQDPNATPNAHSPILFYSEDTHYSIVKSARVLKLKTFYEVGTQLYAEDCPLPEFKAQHMWPKAVPSVGGLGLTGTGSIDVHSLATLVKFFAEKGHPIIINFNYGTAFRGAYDNIEAAWKQLKPIFEENHLIERKVHYDHENKNVYDIRSGYWFHVDGALGAAYMPFIAMAYDKGLEPLIDGSEPIPKFDFDLPYVHSISMSGHKWIGAPWPCGIYMTKRKYQLDPPTEPEYVGADDSTFAGSRNGLSALILWNYLARTSYDKEIEKAMDTQAIAAYAYHRLKNLEEKLKAEHRVDQEGLWLGRSPLSLSVCFKQVKREIASKYSLSREIYNIDGKERAYNHIFAMGHVDKKSIERLIEDLSNPGAFPE